MCLAFKEEEETRNQLLDFQRRIDNCQGLYSGDKVRYDNIIGNIKTQIIIKI